ncbi:Plectin/S10 domain containing protein [Trichomonas vaginalis G3]|uniref:Plectin/S10 domain containing protein n=1 Tax=Trichomonas vaginalis (strain ATCC PRA-98 / G3) TaxID=412133 RepID=A2FYF5_TRIV3|nr:Chain K Plectin/S10 Domain Containing Protein [Trichomonas vaginalis G3]EAX90072.1 Plectin/S10 domain containing protein [Trichomonas vaginalis G3]KAI5515525.1 Chain K Plectin/S10 Domain Containing Protein [Trichomonas vaginalis G3]|eukprot:XP_001303002.1 Plectin/S10 domain containing protein [Trichomonas vaginalis G3]
MYMPTAIRRRILRYLFENGVLCVSDIQSATHEELDCLNIYPYQIGRAFVTKGFCIKTYAWSHAYYTLTDKGIEYLRNYFGLPANAAPATLREAEAKVLETRRDRPQGRGPRRFGNGPRGDRPQRGGFRGPRREQAEQPQQE